MSKSRSLETIVNFEILIGQPDPCKFFMSFVVSQATTGTPVESSINSYLHGIMSGDNSTMEELIKRFVSSCVD